MRVALALLLALPAFAHEGWGIVVHPRFGVVVSDIPANTIWRIDEDGATPLLRDIHSHALILRGDAICGTDPDTNSVWRFDGRLSRVATTPELGLQSFLITPGGTIYSANRYDYRNPKVDLLRRDPTGSVTTVEQGFTSIDGIREASDGSLVIVDGTHLRIGATRIGPLTEMKLGEDLLGLSSVDGETVHVADHAGRRILRVNLRTHAVDVVDRSSFFWAPAGVEHLRGELYVLEHLRPPLALLGDLHIGPYLRVRRNGETLATLWGDRTGMAFIAAVVLVVVIVFVRRYLEGRSPFGARGRSSAAR